MEHEKLLKASRIEGLTDGLFATAMTILVFSVHLPDGTNIHNLSKVLTKDILEVIFIYFGSFIILGIQWIAINFLHGFLYRVNRPYMWCNILYLIPTGIIPFSTQMLIDYPRSQASITFYVINLMCASIIQVLIWHCGSYYKLYNDAYTPFVRKAIIFRLCMPPLFYISSLIVAHWSTRLAFIILLVQPLCHMVPGKVDRYIRDRELGL